MTAWNPMGRQSPHEFNDAANAELLGILVAEGAIVASAVGASPDGTWAEDSFAVSGLDRDRALAIARHFHQESIFEVDDTTVRVIETRGDRVHEASRQVQPRLL